MKHIDDAARLAAVIFAMKRWEWVVRGNSSANIFTVPDEADIAKTLREFLTQMSKGRSERYSSGRLHVEWNKYFDQYEIMLEIGSISPGELWDEERIDQFARAEESPKEQTLSEIDEDIRVAEEQAGYQQDNDISDGDPDA